MRRTVLALLLMLPTLACTDRATEDPRVAPAETSECGPARRLVTDVCTELGGDDGCSEVGDVCIALCDGVTSCTSVGADLRVLAPWPVAPSGYCVPCLD